MRRRTARAVIFGTAVAACTLIGGGAAVAASTDNNEDSPLTGSVLEKATKAALDRVGEGTVSDSEVSEEEGAYEVEVLLENGTEVEVQLDKDFKVVAEEQETPDND